MRSWYYITAQSGDTPPTVSILDEIGMWGVTAKMFIDDLRAKAKGAKTVAVEINSPGGSVFDALAIYNALRGHDAEIHVKVLGVAASAASLIAMAGDKITMPENTFLMVHNPLTFAYGNAADLRDSADVLDKIGASLVATYVARSGKPEKDVRDLLDNETWLTAAEAVEWGLADETIPAMHVKAGFELDRLPENVRAVFEAAATPTPEPTPAAPVTLLHEQIGTLAAEAGLGEFAAAWALDPTLENADDVRARIAASRSIVSLCAFVKQPNAATQFIRDNTPLADVRAKLAEMLAGNDPHIDTVPRKTGSEPVANKGLKPLSIGNIWRARHQSQRSN